MSPSSQPVDVQQLAGQVVTALTAKVQTVVTAEVKTAIGAAVAGVNYNSQFGAGAAVVVALALVLMAWIVLRKRGRS
jgi:hypothetical protein